MRTSPSWRTRLLVGTLCYIVLGSISALWAQSDEPRHFEPLRLYFPPGVPAFGENTDEGSSSSFTISQGHRFTAPEELAPWVGQYFYPSLGYALNSKLNRKRKEALESYRTTRLQLLGDLSTKLAELSPADSAAREKSLIAFAQTQTAAVNALESSAEKLRVDLSNSVDFELSNLFSIAPPGVPSSIALGVAARRQMRCICFLQDGLSIEQRDLLTEIAAEDERASPTRRLGAIRGPAPNFRQIYFYPANSRITLPDSLDQVLNERITAFLHDKEQLKNELRQFVADTKTDSNRARARKATALAERQWPRLSDLEKRAEEIRRGLAAIPKPVITVPAHLPPDLKQRILDSRQELMDFYRHRPRQIRIESDEPSLPSLGINPTPEAMRARAEARIAKVRELIQAEQAKLRAIREKISALGNDLASVAATITDPDTGQPYAANKLLRQYLEAQSAFDQLGRDEVIYKDYYSAVLEPGLSPPQRRMLFAVAIADLAQPLPDAEFIMMREY